MKIQQTKDLQLMVLDFFYQSRVSKNKEGWTDVTLSYENPMSLLVGKKKDKNIKKNKKKKHKKKNKSP